METCAPTSRISGSTRLWNRFDERNASSVISGMNRRVCTMLARPCRNARIKRVSQACRDVIVAASGPYDAAEETPEATKVDAKVPAAAAGNQDFESYFKQRLPGAPVIHILSAYRSPAYNHAIGGASKSQHMQFSATDIFSPTVSPLAIWQELVKMRNEGFFKGGLGHYATFTHVDTRGRNDDWSG